MTNEQIEFDYQKKLQSLVNITFELCMNMNMHPWFKEKKRTNEEIGEWVAAQLRDCGFDTKPIGSSWGVLMFKND